MFHTGNVNVIIVNFDIDIEYRLDCVFILPESGTRSYSSVRLLMTITRRISFIISSPYQRHVWISAFKILNNASKYWCPWFSSGSVSQCRSIQQRGRPHSLAPREQSVLYHTECMNTSYLSFQPRRQWHGFVEHAVF